MPSPTLHDTTVGELRRQHRGRDLRGGNRRRRAHARAVDRRPEFSGHDHARRVGDADLERRRQRVVGRRRPDADRGRRARRELRRRRRHLPRAVQPLARRVARIRRDLHPATRISTPASAGRSNRRTEPFALFSTLSGGSLSVRTYTGNLETLAETATNLGVGLLNARTGSGSIGWPRRSSTPWTACRWRPIRDDRGPDAAESPPATTTPIAARLSSTGSGAALYRCVQQLRVARVQRRRDGGVDRRGWTSTTPRGLRASRSPCAERHVDARRRSWRVPSCGAPSSTSPQTLGVPSRYVRCGPTSSPPTRATRRRNCVTSGSAGALQPCGAAGHAGHHLAGACRHRLARASSRARQLN